MSELGPGFLRRAPRGWLPARAYPLEHRATEQSGSAATGADHPITTARLEVRWRVQIEGRQPYELVEARKAPGWCLKNTLLGKRWYSVRLRGTHGLLPEVGVPCHVDPGNRENLWVDWDRAYDEHTEAWNRKERVEREVGRRQGGLASVVARIENPFAGRIREDEAHLVDDALAAQRAEEERLAAAAAATPVSPAQAEWDRRCADMERIYATGRPARATIVANEATQRVLNGIPVQLITFDVHEPAGTRRVVLEYVWGARPSKRYKPGRSIEVRIDPGNPDAIAIAER